MKEAKMYKTLPLNGSENGAIEFAVIDEAYGEKSQAVVSIRVTLDESQSWKIHIPLAQVKEVRKALKDSKEVYKKYKKEAKKEARKEAKLQKEQTKKTKKSKKCQAESSPAQSDSTKD